jgi:hypothetical protein
VLFRGETAQLSECIDGGDQDSPFGYLWSGAIHGVRHPTLDICGQALGPDQPIMALYDPSVACNDTRLIRQGFVYRYGPRYFADPKAADDLRAAAEPCAIYDHALAHINGWYNEFTPIFKMTAISHNTRGGIEEKLGGTLFLRGLSAELVDLFPPPQILKKVVAWIQDGSGKEMSDEDIYRTGACGQRAFVALQNESDVSGFTECMASFGVTAKRAGVTKLSRVARIAGTSTFSGKTFEYKPRHG